jgi:hypothetical protein
VGVRGVMVVWLEIEMWVIGKCGAKREMKRGGLGTPTHRSVRLLCFGDLVCVWV